MRVGPAGCTAFLLVATAQLCLVACGEPSIVSSTYEGYVYSSDVPLVRVYRRIMPKPVFNLLDGLARAVVADRSLASRKQLNLRHDKDYTYWSDRSSFQSNPSNAVELAISSLFHVAFDNLPASVQSQVAGAEWWIQRRQGTRGISFHYDKDEGIASEHSWMKMPIFSTVTYLTDSGSPTLIFNQTTDRYGNADTPRIPSELALVFPQRGHHVIFRGNLNHGVPDFDWLSEASEGDDDAASETATERWTFLVNWWDQRPIAPYCQNFVPVPGAAAEQHISATMPKVRALTDRIRSGRLASTHQRMPDSKFQASLPPARDQQSVLSRGFNMRAWLPSASTHRLVAEHPPDVRVLVPLSTNLHASGAAWLRYPHGYIQGAVHVLDLAHPGSQAGLAYSRVPVLLFFSRLSTDAAQDFEFNVLFPLSAALGEQAKIYTVAPHTFRAAEKLLGEELPAELESEMRMVLHVPSTKATVHGHLADASDSTSAVWDQLLEFVQSASAALGVPMVPAAASESCPA